MITLVIQLPKNRIQDVIYYVWIWGLDVDGDVISVHVQLPFSIIYDGRQVIAKQCKQGWTEDRSLWYTKFHCPTVGLAAVNYGHGDLISIRQVDLDQRPEVSCNAKSLESVVEEVSGTWNQRPSGSLRTLCRSPSFCPAPFSSLQSSSPVEAPLSSLFYTPTDCCYLGHDQL